MQVFRCAGAISRGVGSGTGKIGGLVAAEHAPAASCARMCVTATAADPAAYSRSCQLLLLLLWNVTRKRDIGKVRVGHLIWFLGL